MLHTVYSNYYEVLKALLAANLTHERLSDGDDAVFDEYRVIVPSLAVQDDLMRSMADERGVCAGVRFEFIGEWFKPLSGIDSAVDRTASSLVWYVWAVLSDPDFVARYERLRDFFATKDAKNAEVARYDLSLRVAAVFKKYVTYRLDWVLDWLGVESQVTRAPTLREQREKQALEASPDFEWQKALWVRLGQDDSTRLWPETESLRALPALFKSAQWARSVTRPVHLFMPFSVTPLLLPYLRKLTSDPINADVWLYVLNPCSEYWFESVPKTLCDWSTTDQSERLTYLTRSAQSTRAMIDRLWMFTSGDADSQASLLDVVAEDEAASDPVFDQTVRIRTEPFDIVRHRLQELTIDAQTHVEPLYIDPGRDTLLAAVQQAVLKMDASVLPEMPDPNDRSVRIVQAPNATREVESLVDQLYELFKDPDIRPDDVLVVTPDIQAMSPIIDGVMNALPADRRIAWRIVGRSVLSENLSAQAVVDLGDMLAGRMSLDELEAWLELPIVTRHWKLSLADLSVMRSWLVQAGFRFGLSKDHLRAQNFEDEYDGCLDRALERLTCGFMFSEQTTRVYASTLPVTGERDTSFDTVTLRPELFQTLLRLCGTLNDAYAELLGVKTERTPAVWAEQIARVMDACFGTQDETEELAGVRRAIRQLTRTMQEALGKDHTVSFALFWHAFKEQLSEKKSPGQAKGAVTFAEIGHARGMPFKVIAVLGLNNDSSFPGISIPEEFDLTAVKDEQAVALRRRGDRDSRSDNRNVFFTLLCSARRHFIVSYSIGEGGARAQPRLPSPVVPELTDFLTTNAKARDLKDGTTTCRAAFESAMTVKLPLVAHGVNNFLKDDAKFWRSHDRTLFDLVLNRVRQGSDRPETPFADARLQKERFGSFACIDQLADFWYDTESWTLKRAEIPVLNLKDERELAVCPDDEGDRLGAYKRKAQILDWLKKGFTPERIEILMAADPTNGAVEVRDWYGRMRLQALQVQQQQFDQEIASCEKSARRTIEYSLADAKELVKGVLSVDCPIDALSMELDDAYRDPDGSCWLVANKVRGRDLLRLRMQQLLLCAVGMPHGSKLVLDKYDKQVKGWVKRSNPLEAELAKSVLDVMAAVWLLTVSNEPALIRYKVTSGSTQSEEAGVLWRGRDEKRAFRMGSAMYGVLGSLFESKKKSSTDQAAALAKALGELVHELEEAK